MRLWPDTLAGRTLILLISMTLLLTIGSAFLLHDERNERFEERNRFFLIKRVVTIVNLISDADKDERLRISKKLSSEGDVVELAEYPLVSSFPRHPLERALSHKLRRELGIKDRSGVRVMAYLKSKDDSDNDEKWIDRNKKHRNKRVRDLQSITLSVRLRDNAWINFRTVNFKGPPPWAERTLKLFALLLIALIISGLIIARRIANPMAQLADAANRFGLDRSLSALPEKGPREVRQTIRAFNQMQERLQKHISDRSQMLAAVSHDLRTPITILRLRAEYIEDQEMREKTLVTLAEMEAILSATLSFARDEAADEQSRATDLSALLQSLVDDHSDMGEQAKYEGPDKTIFTCRPVSLRRALNNLIDNALKYGKNAEVRLIETRAAIEITIDDSGPGIPEGKLEEVFNPFYRLESSRNLDTGGTGLGLAIAKSIIIAHGGSLTLENRAKKGLRAVILLPKDSA